MTFQTVQPGTRIDEFFWIKWVLANALGFAAGGAVPSWLQQAIVWQLVGTSSGNGVGAIGGIPAWVVYVIFNAVAIGAAQWLVLRRRVRWAGAWFLATSLGWLAGAFVVPGLFVGIGVILGPMAWSPVSVVALGLVPIVLAALPQWLILRRQVLQAGWWVVASLAGVVAGVVGYLAGYFGSPVVAGVLMRVLGKAWRTEVLVGLTLVMIGAAIGAVTGVALRELLKRPIQETLGPPTSMIRTA